MDPKDDLKISAEKWDARKAQIFEDTSAVKTPPSRRRPDWRQLSLMGISAAFVST